MINVRQQIFLIPPTKLTSFLSIPKWPPRANMSLNIRVTTHITHITKDRRLFPNRKRKVSPTSSFQGKTTSRSINEPSFVLAMHACTQWAETEWNRRVQIIDINLVPSSSGLSEWAIERTNERGANASSGAEQAKEWVMRANKRVEERMAQYSTRRFHSHSTHCGVAECLPGLII